MVVTRPGNENGGPVTSTLVTMVPNGGTTDSAGSEGEGAAATATATGVGLANVGTRSNPLGLVLGSVGIAIGMFVVWG